MVLADLFNEAAPLSRLWKLLKEPILVVLCPAFYWQLRDLDKQPIRVCNSFLLLIFSWIVKWSD